MTVIDFTAEELTTEIWLPIPDYEHAYAVSNLGRVKRTVTVRNSKAGHILKPKTCDGRYAYLHLRKDGQSKQVVVHRLVAAAFIGPRPKGQEINHIDGNGFNNRPNNLEYVTHSENMKHSYTAGLCSGRDGNYNPNRTGPRYVPKGVWVHRLVEKDALSQTGVCTNCGSVKLTRSKGRLRCANSKRRR